MTSQEIKNRVISAVLSWWNDGARRLPVTPNNVNHGHHRSWVAEILADHAATNPSFPGHLIMWSPATDQYSINVTTPSGQNLYNNLSDTTWGNQVFALFEQSRLTPSGWDKHVDGSDRPPWWKEPQHKGLDRDISQLLGNAADPRWLNVTIAAVPGLSPHWPTNAPPPLFEPWRRALYDKVLTFIQWDQLRQARGWPADLYDNDPDEEDPDEEDPDEPTEHEAAILRVRALVRTIQESLENILRELEELK